MSGGKETPRQKMIGMMYLFYTALLALNVSAEILTAFTMVDGSLRKTNTITEGVIDGTQNEFVKAMVNDSASVVKYKNLADEVVAEADKAFREIQHYKLALVGTLEGVYSADYTKNRSNSRTQLQTTTLRMNCVKLKLQTFPVQKTRTLSTSTTCSQRRTTTMSAAKSSL